ncbi:MAG: hypothetical protein V5A45_09605 [Haloarculaceae archaeon]
MSQHVGRTRRSVLLACLGTVGALAGCSGSGETNGDSPAGTEDLDLREANVVDVTIERDGSSVTFDVTLHHDDDGESGYANWWQVETVGGERLGRRELTHAHSTQPFTRSGSFDIGTNVSCVVVRGHDQTHEYGGQAMVVSLETGTTRPVSQGPDRQSLGAADCP